MSENWPSFKLGKLDLLFHISHLLDLRTGGRSLTASAIYSGQAYAALLPLKVGASCIARMHGDRVEAAGLEGAGADAILVYLALTKPTVWLCNHAWI